MGNVKSYFSGHYQCYGVNVQAVADHHCRFLFVALAACGVTGDRDAIQHCGLSDLIEQLPVGICVIGDAAYEPSEHLVPVYQGIDRLVPINDNFNFYASQCRIRVEMAFGQMVMKWGILQRPCGLNIGNLRWMVQAIGRLHNYAINERLLEEEVEDAHILWRQQELRYRQSYLPSTPHDEDDNPIELDARFTSAAFRGYSALREHMTVRIKELQLQRNSSSKKRSRPET